jgi:hypothetical protein
LIGKGKNMIPPYLHKSVFNKKTIKYEWNDWDPYEVIAEANEGIIKALSTISLPGMLCFVVGCIEWVAYRCSYDDKYRLPCEYIEAFWVYLAGVETAIPEEVTDDDRWEGPLDGPVNLVLGKFYTTIHTSDFGGSPAEAAIPAQVVLHVLDDPKPFLRWQTAVLDRLNKFYPSETSVDGFRIIPQQILDPDFDFRMELANSLVRRMLLNIDFTSNRFLDRVRKDVSDYANSL